MNTVMSPARVHNSPTRSFRKENTMREPRHIHRHSGYRRGTDTSTATRDSAQSGSVSVSGTPTKAMMARRGAGTGRLSPLVLRRAKYAVRSSSQTEDEEAKCQRVMNFQPTQEISLHSRCITAVRMSTDFDDPFIVTAGLDCMVFVTSYRTGDVLKIIDTDNSFVFSVDISADNTVFATAAQDGCVRIYSRKQRWECVRVIKQSSPGMCRIIWAVQLHTTARGHRYCVSAGATKVIHVFDWETGVERCTLRGHLEGVRCLAIASDGTMASGSNDFTVRLWNLLEGKFLFTLRGHSAEVNALCFMPNSTMLVTACENNIFRVWNYIDGSRLMIFDGYRGLSILSMAPVPGIQSAPWILVGGTHTKGYPNLSVEIWNTETGDKVANLRGCRYQICGIDMQCVRGDDGEESYAVVAGGLDSKIRCWNLDAILGANHLKADDIVIDLETMITADNSIISFEEKGD